MPDNQIQNAAPTVELEIERLAYQGYGVARRDGRVHFVRGGLPGERVSAEVVRRGPRVAFAETRAVRRPSPQRVTPPCPVFGRCGGCQFLHADYALQVEAKTEFVRDAFRRRPDDAARVRDCVPAADPFRFRNRMSYSVALDGGRPVVGLHERGRPDAVCDACACVIAPAWHNELLEITTAALSGAGGGPAGWPRRLDLREGRRTGHRMATLSPPPSPEFARRWMARCGAGLTTVVFSEWPDPRGGAVARRTAKGAGWIEERLDRWSFEIGPHTFFQTNTDSAEALFRAAGAIAAEIAPARVIELYAGVGALTVFVAAHAQDVLAIERHAPSVEAARRNLRRNFARNVRFHRGAAADIRPTAASEAADLIVVDPPRAGLDAGARAAIAAWNPPWLLYVSCDPMTLARDVEALETSGYRLNRVQPFDLFPQTFHVECLALLEK